MEYPKDFINKVIQGDCLEVMKLIPDKSVGAIVTDPPFGIGFKYQKKEEFDNPKLYWKWLKPIYKEMKRVLKSGGFIAIWQSQKYLRFSWKWFGKDIRVYAGCKNFVQLKKIPINYGYDPIILKYKKGQSLSPLKPERSIDFFVANTAKFVTEVNSFAGEHPCPRPIDQVIEIIKNFVIEKEIVLDPFLGSGTTAVACIQLGRNFIGIEKEPKYCEIANKRIEFVKAQTKLSEMIG